uniref:Uncharacterized protein n=1 Tax=Solanum tuberosum TaxID=4113 RepID=M1D6U7_SOLTU
MLKHRLRFQAPSSAILLFSISIDLGVSLHMWKWKFEKTPTHLQRIKKDSKKKVVPACNEYDIFISWIGCEHNKSWKMLHWRLKRK